MLHNFKFAYKTGFVGFLWVLILVGGIGYVVNYSYIAGKPTEAPTSWPTAATQYSEIKNNNLPKLLVFLHPMCSCSKSSLNELDRLAPTLTGVAEIYTIFVFPDDDDDGWMESDLYVRAANNPNYNLIIDHGRHLSYMFGTHTSGATLIYDDSNKLVYNGGLTVARSHEGPSIGNIRIKRWALEQKLKRQPTKALAAFETEVYGCSIHKRTN